MDDKFFPEGYYGAVALQRMKSLTFVFITHRRLVDVLIVSHKVSYVIHNFALKSLEVTGYSFINYTLYNYDCL